MLAYFISGIGERQDMEDEYTALKTELTDFYKHAFSSHLACRTCGCHPRGGGYHETANLRGRGSRGLSGDDGGLEYGTDSSSKDTSRYSD